MQFQDFAKAHGLIINSLSYDKWVRVPTTDHPYKKNGAYIYNGHRGAVQNWATMEKPAVWKSEEKTHQPANLTRILRAADDRKELADKAAAKAGWIMHQTVMQSHPYMERKGFPDEKWPVWEDNGERKLVIPMRIGDRLVGCQLINEQGEKKFLYGQTTKGASFLMDAKGIPIFCEGFATGNSVRLAMKSSNLRYRIYICFSAGNLKEVARAVGQGIIVADNDPSHVGQSVAIETGHPYWISSTTGEDFNDYHNKVGIFTASQSLKKVLMPHYTSQAFSQK